MCGIVGLINEMGKKLGLMNNQNLFSGLDK